MKIFATLAAGLCFALVGACDTIPKRGTRSYLSVVTQPHKGGEIRTIGTLFVWSSEVNAGVIYQEGHVCMQRAMTMKARSIDGAASVPSSLVSISEAAKVAMQTSNTQAAVELSGAIREAATSLSTSTERTALLDIGMFYLCQLEANRAVTPDQAAILTQQLIRDVVTMAPVTGVVASATPAPLPPIQNIGTRRSDPGAQANRPPTAGSNPTGAVVPLAENRPPASGSTPSVADPSTQSNP